MMGTYFPDHPCCLHGDTLYWHGPGPWHGTEEHTALVEWLTDHGVDSNLIPCPATIERRVDQNAIVYHVLLRREDGRFEVDEKGRAITARQATVLTEPVREWPEAILRHRRT